MTRRWAAPAVLGAIVVLPRLLRMAWPQVWIEDDGYLSGVFALSEGLLPYRDFPLPHLPLLEAAAALVLRLPLASIRSIELFTQLAAAAGTMLVYTLGRRLGGVGPGLAAALVFSASPLLFRYHLFEREVFLVGPAVSAVVLALGDVRRRADSRSASSAIAIGALAAVAMGIKLTAIASLAGIAGYLYSSGRRRSAAVAVATAAALVAAVAVSLTMAFGTDFVAQVVLFRILHATFPSLGVKMTELRLTLDIALAMGIAGIVLILWSGRGRHWSVVWWQLASGLVVLVLLNPTYWAHTGIELLPWLALPAGYLVANFGLNARSAVCAAIAVVCVATVSPVQNLNWQAGDGSPMGFGYRDRAEIDAAGRFVAEHTAPDDRVLTPPLIALAARRLELLPYLEIAGDVQEITAAVRREGYRGALRDPSLARGTFWESVEQSARITAPQLRAAIGRGAVGAVANDSPDDLLPVPLIDVAPEDLRAARYSMEAVTPHYEIWIRR